jgi:hypothetical protein
MNKIVLFLLAGLLFSSCTRTVYVPILRPSQVHVGQHVQSLALVDRSETQKTNVSRIESIITGEMPGLDKEMSQVAMDALARELQDNQRYRVVRTSENLKSPTLPGQWPPLLDWFTVEQLCKKYNTDALLVLESFDSNFIVTNGSRAVKKKDKDGVEITSNEFYATGVATVNMGFRFYDPLTKTIIDEHMYGHNRKWETTGNLLQMAVGSMIDHRQAVRDVSLQSGRMYSTRISPNWIRAHREFFTKGKGNANFAIGARRATVNDWKGATEAWSKSAGSSKRKTAGRSYYNLALMHEIQGDLDTALRYSQTAYTDYRIKQARSYSNVLRRRIRDASLLD